MARKRKKRVAAESTEPEAPDPFEGLADPPRHVSGRLKLHLVLHPLFVVGCVGIGIVGLFLPSALALDMPMNPFATPAWSKAEGEFDRVDRRFVDIPSGPKGRQRSKQLRYYYQYHFRLSDGRVLAGESYRLKPLNPPPRPNSKVSIEYDPTRPEVNRLQGTSVDLPISPALPLLFLLLVAVVMAGCALGFSLPKILLLSRGRPGWAFLTSVKVREGKETTDVPLDEFKQQLRDNLRDVAHQLPYIVVYWMFGSFLGLFAGFFGAFLGFVAWGYWSHAFGDPGAASSPMIPAAVGFLVGFGFVILGPLRWRRRRWLDESRGIGPPRPLPRQDFGYVFETDTGEVIEGHQVVRLTTLDDEPPHPMLYNPSKPRRALLLTNLTTAPVVSNGGWDAQIGKGVFVRLALVVASLVVAPLIGLWYVSG
jgi:hypothetical protein